MYCKLTRIQSENTEEWWAISELRHLTENIKKKIEDLKKQFISGINDDDIMTEIL